MAPIRDRVMKNNEQISSLLTDQEIHNDKLRILEIIYKNRLETKNDGDDKIDKPLTVFDTICNQIADNAAFCRQREQDLQG